MVQVVSAARVGSVQDNWPAGTRAGDTAVLVVASPDRSFAMKGWSVNGTVRKTITRKSSPFFTRNDTYYAHILTRKAKTSVFGHGLRPPGDFPSQGTHPSWLFIFRDTQGIGAVRSGSGRVPAKPGGGAVVAVLPPEEDSALPGDVNWLPVSNAGRAASNWWATAGYVVTNSTGTVGAETDWPAIALEILPPEGPQPPVLLAPSAGQLSNTEPITFEWQHRPSLENGRQDAYRLILVGDSGVWYWSQATGSLVRDEVANESSQETATISPDLLGGTGRWEWQVLTRESIDGRWSPASPVSGFELVTPPSVQVLDPSSVHDDLTPTVTWSPTTPHGVQTAWRVQVARLGVLLYDSGSRPGPARSHILPVLDWENGALYQVLVQVQQTGGAWSPWVIRDFVVSWTRPATPNVEAWADREGVLVRVTADPGLMVTVERVTREGLWVPVAAPFAMPASGTATLIDVLAPYEVSTAYRAQTANVLEGMPLTSEWGLSQLVRSTDPRSYLAAVGDPARTWVRLMIEGDGPHTHERPVAVAYGLGDTRARVSYGPGRGMSGSLQVHAFTREEEQALLALLHSGESLIVRWPAEAVTDGAGFIDGGTLTFAVASTVEVTRRSQRAPTQLRVLSVSWVEQDTPVGGGTSAPLTHPIEGD